MTDNSLESITIDIDEDEIAVTTAKPADDTAEIDAASQPKKEAKPDPKTASEGLDDLARQLEESKRAAAEANERAQREAIEAQRARQEAAQARSTAVDSEHQAVLRAIEAKERERGALKAEYQAAIEKGDFGKTTELVDTLADIAADLHALKRDRQAVEARVAAHDANRTQPHEGRVPTQQQPQQRQVDPVDAFIAAVVSPRSRSWLQANRHRIADETALRWIIRRHEDLIDRRVVPESADYFDKLNMHLDELNGTTPREEATKPDPKPVPKRATTYAAPVSRDTPAYSSRQAASQTRITLSPEQREAAIIAFGENDPNREKKYAKLLLEMQGEQK